MAIRAKARGLGISVTMTACGALDPVPWENSCVHWSCPGPPPPPAPGQVPAQVKFRLELEEQGEGTPPSLCRGCAAHRPPRSSRAGDSHTRKQVSVRRRPSNFPAAEVGSRPAVGDVINGCSKKLGVHLQEGRQISWKKNQLCAKAVKRNAVLAGVPSRLA